MDNQLAPYDMALDLKELGFDEPCIFVYNGLKDLYGFNHIDGTHAVKNSRNFDEEVTAPMYQQVFEWLRDEHSIDALIIPFFNGGYGVECYKGGSLLPVEVSGDSYPDARDKCLRGVIKFLKDKS